MSAEAIETRSAHETKHATPEAGSAPRSGRSVRRVVVFAAAATVSAGLSGWLVGSAVSALAGDRNEAWILGRAAGISAYLLMVALVLMGLLLSHPRRTRWRRPSSPARIRIHIALAVFALALLVLHIVVLATDEYADVGWWGAFVPMASTYRPVAVTLGVVAAYAGLFAGLTAALAGSIAARIWWPVHKVAGLTMVLTWAHAVLAGSDTGPLAWLYIVTAGLVIALGASRYLSRTPADRLAELTGRSS